MTNTAVLTEDSATIVTEAENRFHWGAAIAGSIGAVATVFFLLSLGSGVGLALAAPAAAHPTVFLTLGAVYFFAAQAFGFAVGGYLVGRLMGPEAENSKEEEFHAAAHGFVMWALAILASLFLAGVASAVGGSTMAAAVFASRADNSSAFSTYQVDAAFRPAQNSPQVTADKTEVTRILAADGANANDADTARMARLIAQDAGISAGEANSRVEQMQASLRQAADNVRKAASYLSLWAAFALLFGAAVSVVAAIMARREDDRISFGGAADRSTL